MNLVSRWKQYDQSKSLHFIHFWTFFTSQGKKVAANSIPLSFFTIFATVL